MARARPRRRTARTGPIAPGRRGGPAGPPAPARPAATSRVPAGRWRRRSTAVRVAAVLVVLGVAALVAVDVWLQRQPPRPDAAALHADIAARRSGAEVTFTATLLADPTESGGHQRMSVRDELGDVLELDYNTSLGRPVPVHAGSAILVHGQLYVDPGQAGVHCLHGQTSRGCPEPGWIRFAGATYS